MPKFKVGDKVRLKDFSADRSYMHNVEQKFTPGDIGEVVVDDGSTTPKICVDYWGLWSHEHNWELVVEEEEAEQDD